jgi:predicted transcriptional regulator
MNNKATYKFSELTTKIVSAYISNHTVRAEDLPTLITDLHAALQSAPERKGEPASESQQPAVAIKKSVTPDYIISLENGQKFKSLKRHLMSTYGMTPQEYRDKWGLPREYPMVAPNYAKSRSELAKTMGLGRKAAAAEPIAVADVPIEASKRRGRPKLAPNDQGPDSISTRMRRR